MKTLNLVSMAVAWAIAGTAYTTGAEVKEILVDEKSGDKLIMDRSQLEQAPVLSGNQAPGAATGTWSREADDYWRAKSSTSRDLLTGHGTHLM